MATAPTELSQLEDQNERLKEENERLREAWATIALTAEGDDSPVRDDAFADEPPSWARDPFNYDAAESCGLCGAWCSVVRPGKTQCDVCWDGKNTRYIACAALEDKQKDSD